MPVVAPEIASPSDWLRVTEGIGVIRDGDRLRCWVRNRSGNGTPFQFSMEEWRSGEGEAVRDLRTRLQRGAFVVAGIPPSKNVVRELQSPLQDLSKSDEIWPSLFDSLLPFPLEECHLALAPPEPDPEGGYRCLATASRTSDVQDLLEEWTELGLRPDLLVPEVLLLSGEGASMLWKGEHRAVVTTWKANRFLGASEIRGGENRARQLARFQAAWQSEVPEGGWRECGPGAPQQPHLLEEAAAGLLFREQPRMLNLLEGEASPRLQTAVTAKKKRLTVSAAVLLLLLLAAPWMLRRGLTGIQKQIRADIAAEYEHLTGEPSTAPGMEVTLARRYVQESLGDRELAVREVSGPAVSLRMARLLRWLQELNLVTTRVTVDPQGARMEVLAEETELQQLRIELEKDGDAVEIRPAANGTWMVEVKAL